MSELRTNKISPSSDTEVTLGDSGDTFTIPSGVTITNSGTANGFGGGAWSVKSSGTASAVSSLSVTSLTKTTRIILTNFIGSAAPTNVGLRTSSNNGSSYDNGGSDYRMTLHRNEYSIGSYQQQNQENDGIYAMTSIGNGALDNNIFDVTLFSPANVGRHKMMQIMNYQYEHSNGVADLRMGYAQRKSGSIINAVQFFLTVGGTFSCDYIYLELN